MSILYVSSFVKVLAKPAKKGSSVFVKFLVTLWMIITLTCNQYNHSETVTFNLGQF